MAWSSKAARVRTRCPVCERPLRPCNLLRHLEARHPESTATKRQRRIVRALLAD